MKQKIMSILFRLAYLARKLYWYFWRPVTLGVNVLVIREDQVLLVRPTYRHHWTLPGGGINRGETLAQAAAREVREEVGLELHDMSLFGLYSNLTAINSDHIAIFVAHVFAPTDPTQPHTIYEIDDYRFFPFDQLPPDTGEGTRRRLEEYQRETAAAFRNW
jgi:ADP-ribose pyrophosphatase YjhB (NUDIX family)